MRAGSPTPLPWSRTKSTTFTSESVGTLPPLRLVLTSSRPAGDSTLPFDRSFNRSISRTAPPAGLMTSCLNPALSASLATSTSTLRVSLVDQPVRRRVGRTDNGRLVVHPPLLRLIEEADDRHHAQFVRAIEDSREPRHVVRPQRAVGLERRAHPRLRSAVSLRAAALEVDGERPAAPSPSRAAWRR